MQRKTDPALDLRSFIETEIKGCATVNFLRWQIQNNGFVPVKWGDQEVRIYSPELVWILTSPRLTGYSQSTKKEVALDHKEYLNTYVQAFIQGELNFEREFRVPPQVLYGDNRQFYVKNLHHKYYHAQHWRTHDGWAFVKSTFPFILTHEDIEAYGYFSGIVSKVDELFEQHPQLFANFHQRNEDEVEPLSDPDIDEVELRRKIEKHFGFFSGQCPRKHKTILKENDFKSLIDWTVAFYSSGFEVPNISHPIQTVNTNKTYVQLAFKYLFKEIYPNRKYPDSLFVFYRTAFSRFSADKKASFIGVSNNDEVKKLMHIDY